MVTISVVIPTLNEEILIGDLLGSLENGSHPEYEAIIVDGGGTDRTREIARARGARFEERKGLNGFPSGCSGAELASGGIV